MEEGYCDCDENILDECDECGGDGIDEDNDGVCDDIDPCIGEYVDGYYCSDLQVLQDFINQNSVLDSINIFDIGNINWWNDDGRMVYLSLADLNLISVPETIENLSFLETLYLNDNNLNSIPENICNLSASCEIYLYNNELCEEYHFSCIDHWNPQNCSE